MSENTRQSAQPQLLATGKSPVKRARSGRHRKRKMHLLPHIARMIPGMYVATGFDSERVANDLQVSRVDVLDAWNEHVIRTGMLALRNGFGKPVGCELGQIYPEAA